MQRGSRGILSATTGRLPGLDSLAARVHAAQPGKYREITNAMSGTPLGRVRHCSTGNVAARARQAQKDWATRPIAERSAVLMRPHDLV
ncbi:hypothetical protein [Mycobacterium simiae]|uniref:hypothetical protein n=1 Tax=Mycobacterium simiae TaxID=1784 RepID=UPI0021CD44E7|nr:hypothetical protein [Mycobacterium simiae]